MKTTVALLDEVHDVTTVNPYPPIRVCQTCPAKLSMYNRGTKCNACERREKAV